MKKMIKNLDNIRIRFKLTETRLFLGKNIILAYLFDSI